MRKYSPLFLIVTVITGILGFSGIDFEGIEVVRVLFLIFADLLVISLLARIILSKSKMKLERVNK